jgi:hypothetical protein
VFLAADQGQNWMGTGARSGEGEVGDEIESRAEQRREDRNRPGISRHKVKAVVPGVTVHVANQPYSFPALQSELASRSF